MTPVPYESLPKAVRDRVDASDAKPATRRSREATAPGLPMACHQCGEPVSGTGDSFNKHQAETGHSRFQAVLS